MTIYSTTNFISDLENIDRGYTLYNHPPCFKEIDKKIGAEYTKAQFRRDLFAAIGSNAQKCCRNFLRIKEKIDRNQLRRAIVYLEKKHYSSPRKHPFRAQAAVDWSYENNLSNRDPSYFKNEYDKGISRIFEQLRAVDGYRSIPAILAGGTLGAYAFSGFAPALLTMAAAGILLKGRGACKALANHPKIFGGIVAGTLALAGMPALITGAASGLLYKGYKIYQDLGNPPAKRAPQPGLRHRTQRSGDVTQ